MIVCAGDIEQFPFATPIGIGIAQAAINTVRISISKKPKSLLFIGTAGSYGNGKIFDLYCSNESKNIEIGYLQSKSYTPITLEVLSNIPQDVSRETYPFICTNSSNYICTDESMAKLFTKKGCEIENMEFYGFLSAAKALNIDAFGLFCITNFCNDRAHSDFLKNHKRAKELLSEAINSHFKAFI